MCTYPCVGGTDVYIPLCVCVGGGTDVYIPLCGGTDGYIPLCGWD